MLEFNLLLAFTSVYWILLLASLALIGAVGIYSFISNRSFHRDFVKEILEMAQEVEQLERYHIDNLGKTNKILESSKYPLITTASLKLKKDSHNLYQDQWISSPDEVFSLEKVLDKSQFRSYTLEYPLYILTIGVLMFLAFLIGGLNLSDNKTYVLMVSSTPLFLSLIIAFTLSVIKLRNKDDLKRALNYLSERIKERVPVFRELAGTAALIEAFFRYDRSMSNSVSEFSKMLNDLSENKVAEIIGENVKVSLEESLLPSINSTLSALQLSTEKLAIEKNESIEEISEYYSRAITSSLERNLQPFYQELENFANNIYEANKSTEITLQNINQHRKESGELQASLLESLDSLKLANKSWTNNLNSISDSMAELAKLSKNLSATQKDSESILSDSIKALKDQLSIFEDNMNVLTEKINEQNQNFIDRFESASSSSLELKNDIKELGLLFAVQTEALSHQNIDVAQEINSLNEGLNASVQNFTSGINEGVISVLANFDNSIAEISDRLIDTSSEINSSVNAWISEMEYQEQRRARNLNNSNKMNYNKMKQDKSDVFLLNNNKYNEEHYDE